MNKILLFIMLMPLFVKAQYFSVIEEVNKDYKAVSKIKGNVKSITVNGSTVNDKDNKSKKMITVNIEALGVDIFTTLNYNRSGDIIEFNEFNSLNHTKTKYSYIYDSLNRLVESRVEKNKSGNKYQFQYDTLNRLIETRYYDTLNNLIERKEQIYKSDTTIEYYPLNKYNRYRIVYIHNKNTTTTLSYSPDGKDLYFKSTETKTGDTIDKKTENYNVAGNYIGQSSSFYTNGKKTTNEKLDYNLKGEITHRFQSKSFFKYNINGDLSEEKYHSSGGVPDEFNDGSYWVNYTFKYIYDSHGNYIKKSGYVHGKLRYQTTRTIEYYD